MKIIVLFLKCGQIFVGFINSLANDNFISIIIQAHGNKQILKIKKLYFFCWEVFLFYIAMQVKCLL